MTAIRFPTPEELDQGFAEQCWQDYLRSKSPTRYPRTDAIAELEGSGLVPAQLTVPPIIPAIEPEGGAWMTPEVEVMAEPRPPSDFPRVTVEAPPPLRAEPTQKWCNQCGKVFRYASAGMAAIQLATHVRRAHGAPIDTRGPDPEGRKQRISLTAARKRARRGRLLKDNGPGTAHVSATHESRPEPAG